MSTPTKLFVILLVVLSLVLTAATVVFVSQVDVTKTSLKTAQEATNLQKQRADALEAQLAAAQAQQQELARQVSTQVEQAKQAVNAEHQQLIDAQTQLGQLKSAAAVQSADLTRLAEALKASEDTKSRLQEQVADLRGSNDKLIQQNAQLNQSNTELTNNLEVTERERKFLSEQLTEAKSQAEKASAMLRDAGISPAQMASAGTRVGAPAINGVIRAVKPIAGIPYATISVGSADGVAKGMEFKIVDRTNGSFLGTLTVDSAELNESTGRLSGPHVDQIKSGAEAKTQL